MESLISRKLRGGFYTPKPIADFLTKWVIKNNSDDILEPSCGDGVFIESVIRRLLSMGASEDSIRKQLHAVEYDSIEAEKALRHFSIYGIKPSTDQVFNGDFFQYSKSNLTDKRQFDCVLGNPPFIRYQDFPEEQRQPAFALMIRAGLKPNRLTNSWIPFLVSSTLLLKNDGRIGMVIPAELFQVNYAAETRKFLSKVYSTLFIITFRKLVFKDVQQEIILLLGEKNGKKNHGIRIVEIDDIRDLVGLDLGQLKQSTTKIEQSSEKWTQYYLSDNEIAVVKRIRSDTSIPLSGEFMDVDVGVVTGQNRFFVITNEIMDKYKLERFTKRVIGKANQIKGIIATVDSWSQLASSNNAVFLLDIPDVPLESLPDGVQRYIQYGISEGFEKGYKCRIRKKWWRVPSIWIPDAFMLRQVHMYPRVVANECNATVTDTLHRVRLLNGMTKNSLSCAFLNSLTLAFSEITGRSYGGGVLTFEPSEAERLPLPIRNAKLVDFEEIDKLVRNNRIEDVLDITDNLLLNKGLDLSQKEITILRGIWRKLRDRRVERRSILIQK